ncbi:hypothetical protein [Persephonella sp.]
MVRLAVAFLLVLSIWVSTTHHHEDGRSHLDCPICVFQLNNSSEDIKWNPVVFHIPEDKVPKSFSPVKSFQKIFIKHFFQRAPPAESV